MASLVCRVINNFSQMNAKFYNYLTLYLFARLLFLFFSLISIAHSFCMLSMIIFTFYSTERNQIVTRAFCECIRAHKFTYLFRDIERWVRTFARTLLTSFVDIAQKMFVELSRMMLREETRHDHRF